MLASASVNARSRLFLGFRPWDRTSMGLLGLIKKAYFFCNDCCGFGTVGANYKYNLYLRVVLWAFRVSELRVLSDVSLTAQTAGPKPQNLNPRPKASLNPIKTL